MIRINSFFNIGLAIAALAALTDQLSKAWILSRADRVENTLGFKQTITPFLDFTLVWNHGVSYGLFATNTPLARMVFIALGLSIVGFLIWQMARETHKIIQCGFGLIIGGALGNIIDRLVHGAVVDFISLHAFNYYWYVFNVSDIWITCGAILVIAAFIFTPASAK